MTSAASARTAPAVAFVALLGLAACSGAFGERVREQFHSTIATGDAPLVRVQNVAGAVRVDGWSKPVVDVNATKFGHDAQDLRNILIGVHQERSGISIVTTYTGAMRGGGVRYRIFVPEGASLWIDNVAGAVDLAGVRGNVDVETQAGTITADVGRVAGDRSVDLRATTGAITLAIAPESSASVEAESTVGDFSSDVPGVTQRRENIVGAQGGGTIGSGSAQIRLTTTTGAIALRERQ
jgi:Putative adhesin